MWPHYEAGINFFKRKRKKRQVLIFIKNIIPIKYWYEVVFALGPYKAHTLFDNKTRILYIKVPSLVKTLSVFRLLLTMVNIMS